MSEGYVAIDEVHFDNNEECKIVPDFANPMTTSNKPGAIILSSFMIQKQFYILLMTKNEKDIIVMSLFWT